MLLYKKMLLMTFGTTLVTCIKLLSVYNSRVRVGNAVDKEAMGEVSLRVLRIYPVSIIPPLLHTHISFICIQSYIILALNGVVKIKCLLLYKYTARAVH